MSSTKKLQVKDLKKRDFLVKQLKKQREDQYYARLEQQQLDEEEAAEPANSHPAAQAIILVHDSYLTRDLASYNKNKNVGGLPQKWSKKRHEEELAQEEEEDEDDDEDLEDEDLEDEDLEDEDDEQTVINTKTNKVDEEDDNTVLNSALLKKIHDIDGNYHTHEFNEESSDDDDEEWDFTKERVVQFISEFNEIQVIQPNTTTTFIPSPALSATRKRDTTTSKSPRTSARATPNSTPKQTGAATPKDGSKKSNTIAAADDDDELDNFKLGGGKSPFVGPAKSDKKQRDLMQQMEDLDLSAIGKKNQKEEDKAPKPEEHSLDAAAWWKYILSHGAYISNDGKFIVHVTKWFTLANEVGIQEDFFHLPQGRHSSPDKPLTAFGLFKQHKLQEDPSLVKKATHAKKNKSKHHANDQELKRLYYQLPEDEIEDYQVMALCEKLRYKVQRAEHVYATSTQFVKKH